MFHKYYPYKAEALKREEVLGVFFKGTSRSAVPSDDEPT